MAMMIVNTKAIVVVAYYIRRALFRSKLSFVFDRCTKCDTAKMNSVQHSIANEVNDCLSKATQELANKYAQSGEALLIHTIYK